ncbi:MAG: beta-xylosidase [Acidobacteriota bacterium]
MPPSLSASEVPWQEASAGATGMVSGQGSRRAQSITIRVNAASRRGPFRPVWAYFGYDEPNFTYMQYGRQLLGELAALSPVPVHIRTHNLLTSGDGEPALKWGSTDVYTEDRSGRPIYHWTIIDKIFDAYRKVNIKALVEIGFMPEALSTNPQPYRHNWPEGELATGWAYPPKDYLKWAELIYQWVRHSVDRYGQAEVKSWYWEVWNEPNIRYWQGTDEEYLKLYDYTAGAVKRALPEARMGGPHCTGPRSESAAALLQKFLEHCVRGKNYVTGEIGSPLDYIGFHVKGRPQIVDGHLRMGIQAQLQSASKGFEIVASFPEFKNLPIILGESDPEGCAACSAKMRPESAYRNGPLYASYTAAVLGKILELSDRYRSNLEGVLTWAFEFEGQPYFAGFRTLATNGINKPILNLFRMLGLMRGERLEVESTGAVDLDQILRAGVREKPDISAIASGRDGEVSILVWHYHDDDLPGPEAAIQVILEGIPVSAQRVLLRHYRIDEHHSNAYTVWKNMGSPQEPKRWQYSRLRAAGQLEILTSPQWLRAEGGGVQLAFSLPRQGVSLLQLNW